jgi:hypothetical protein
MDPAVFLAVPHYDDLVPAALPGLLQPSGLNHVRTLALEGGSLLAMVFNNLWCRALNQRQEWGITHFAMHHADIQAPPFWVDTLFAEMNRVGADVLSVVVPIKDARGLTSTGTRDPVHGNIRRFTMKEIFDLPETFSIADTAVPEQWLMVNTGLWICDFTKPWVEQVAFSILDSILCENGRFQARALPEDWNFSGWCARQGLRVFATRKLPVVHHGRAAYGNDRVWGEWPTDQGDQR